MEVELRKREARRGEEKWLRIGNKLDKIAEDLERGRKGMERELREGGKKGGGQKGAQGGENDEWEDVD
jgi:hypothetical protein